LTDGRPFLYEKWTSDGVRGSTAVFLTEDVARTDDNALKQALKGAEIDVHDPVTITRGETHTFVNFNFEIK